MHRQLFEMLFANELEGFFLNFPGSLQEALSEENFALLDHAPERVMPDVVAAGHLFRLLHHRQRFTQLAFAVQHFAVPMSRRWL